MSADNVFAQFAGERKNLLDKITSNEELSTVIMGLLGRLIFVCEAEKNKPVTGMTFDPWACDGNTFKSRVHFGDSVLIHPLMWGNKGDFFSYAKAKAGQMALALADNPKMEVWFQSLVEHIDQYAVSKGIWFGDLRFSEHIITRDDIVVLKVERAMSLSIE